MTGGQAWLPKLKCLFCKPKLRQDMVLHEAGPLAPCGGSFASEGNCGVDTFCHEVALVRISIWASMCYESCLITSSGWWAGSHCLWIHLMVCLVGLALLAANASFAYSVDANLLQPLAACGGSTAACFLGYVALSLVLCGCILKGVCQRCILRVNFNTPTHGMCLVA